MNASRLAANRRLENINPGPSRGAAVMANDIAYQQQMGQNDLRDLQANEAQRQAAAQFNRDTATTNANILNNTDQFNAQMLANAADRSAQMHYKAASDKLAQEAAWRAGLTGNVNSIFSGLYQAFREGQNANERNLLAASGVFGETNGLLDNYYGINKIDPKTG
jgi:hypothetical protein